MSDLVFQGVPADKIEAVWPFVEDLVAKALDKGADGFFAPEDIKASCEAADMQLWIGREGDEADVVGVTQILVYPRKKVLVWVIVSGRNRKLAARWWEAKPIVEAFARNQGCDAILGYGRRGWKRRYPHLDYEVIHTVWRKEL